MGCGNGHDVVTTTWQRRNEACQAPRYATLYDKGFMLKVSCSTACNPLISFHGRCHCNVFAPSTLEEPQCKCMPILRKHTEQFTILGTVPQALENSLDGNTVPITQRDLGTIAVREKDAPNVLFDGNPFLKEFLSLAHIHSFRAQLNSPKF